MKTFYSNDHLLRNPALELHNGQWVTPFESPQRVDYILAALRDRNLADLAEPTKYDLAVTKKVHDAGYLEFLPSIWSRWQEKHGGDPVPNIWPARRMRGDFTPTAMEAQLGYYALAADSAITEGTWQAASAAKDLAMSATEWVMAGHSSAFALCRPPGHHAARDQFGGYCFLNNAAIAAQYALDLGAKRVAILDVDFHHGNGTQDIFYERDDVLTLSLHGDPKEAFPYFLGHADEVGRAAGVGFNHNYPMPSGTSYQAWSQALEQAFSRIRQCECDFLVVALGVDTFENDPISFFKLASDDFLDYGRKLGQLGLPTVFTMEGGYAVEEIGINTVNVLEGFEQAQPQS